MRILAGVLAVVVTLVAGALVWRHFRDPSSYETSAAVDREASAGIAGKPCTGAAPQPVKHVVVIVLENHDSEEVASNSPYLDLLASKCGLATNYFPITHPSLPNYIAMTSGQTRGFVGRDCSAGPGCLTGARSIFEQVSDWKSYEEGMTTNCNRDDNRTTRYAVRHNPAVYYTRIASECRSSDVPFESPSAGLAFDLDHDSLPAFSFITPDLLHDEHDAFDSGCSHARLSCSDQPIYVTRDDDRHAL